MKRGRRPKPTRLKLISGNPGKRPLNLKEPKPKAGIPDCPIWLEYEAKKIWAKLVPKLERLGILTEIDEGPLAAYCESYSLLIEAKKQLKKMTLSIVDKGKLKLNPKFVFLLRVARDAKRDMVRIAIEFGFTPSSRTRINAEPPGDEETEKKFFG